MYSAVPAKTSSHLHSRVARGFTTIELLVVVALVAILAGLAAPSFTELFRRFRVDAVREEFTSSVLLARSEAIRTGTPIVVRRLTACGVALADNQDWSCGWRVFADVDGNNTMNGAEAAIQEVSVPPNMTVRKGNPVGPEFVAIDRFGQVTQAGQRIEIFPVGMAAVDGQLVCFTVGTRLRTIHNAAVCPP